MQDRMKKVVTMDRQPQVQRSQHQQGMDSQQRMMRPMQPTQSMGMQPELQHMRQFGNAPMPRGPPSDSPQDLGMQSGIGYSPDNGMPHPSPGSQFYSHRAAMPSPLQLQHSQQPQLRMPDYPYPSSPHGSIGSTYIPSLSPTHPSNSPQVSTMYPALRTPGSVSEPHSPAVDYEAWSQGFLDDDIPHSSTQEEGGISDQTIARQNRKRKHRTPSPSNPLDPTSSVPELNDTQDGADLNLTKVEISKLKDFLGLHKLENSYFLRKRLKKMLERMIEQEENECEKQDMIIFHNKLDMFYSSMSSSAEPFSELRTCKWFADINLSLPIVEDIKFEKDEGKLIVTWTAPKWPHPLRYSGECVESSGEKRVVERFENTAETSNILSLVSPIQGYFVIVWAVDQTGRKGPEEMSKRGILCEKYGDIFVDHTSQLRSGYDVFKGYLKSASHKIDEVAVKRVRKVNEKILREVEALQKLRHKHIVTYRLSKDIVERSKEVVVFIAMELCSTDTFQEQVMGNKLDMHCCKISLLHMMLGIVAIHEAGFLHRDLKPQNLLCSLDGRDMKVADFGLCKEMDPNKSKVTKSALEIGTEGWGSPEHYEPNAKMSEKSDIYSAGLISSFGLSDGQHVYGRKAYNWKPSIIEGSKVNLSMLTCDNSEIAKDMISKMLQRHPDNRPTAKQVLVHPFYWDDEKKLNFLHHMSSFFTPVIFSKVTPGQLTQIIMKDLDAKKSIFQTKHGEANWVKKMEEETPEICFTYRHVLLTARCEVYPFTRYNPAFVFDLIRFIRNVEEHYRDENFQEAFNNLKCNVWKFFYKCFPTLLCTVYNAVYKHFPEIESCREFPNDLVKFFTQPADYESLPICSRAI